MWERHFPSGHVPMDDESDADGVFVLLQRLIFA